MYIDGKGVRADMLDFSAMTKVFLATVDAGSLYANKHIKPHNNPH